MPHNNQQSQHSLDETNVFVKHLPAGLDDEGLKELFAPFGNIISLKVMVDPQTGLSLGYGFVRFATPVQAQKAIRKLSGFRIQNKFLLCKFSNTPIPITTSDVSTNLYIKPLAVSTTEDDLVQIFSKFGQVEAAKVMVDRATGKSMQLGFVRFMRQEDATAALEAMHGKVLSPDTPPLIVRYAETDTQRSTRKARNQPMHGDPPSPPPSPPYNVVYNPVQYVPVPVAPYYYYYSVPQVDSYSNFWQPPYPEQAMSY